MIEHMTVAKALAAVCLADGILPTMVRGNGKSRRLVTARWVVARFAVEAGYSYAQIGREINKDPTTVLHGIVQAKRLIDSGRGRDITDLEAKCRVLFGTGSSLSPAKATAIVAEKMKEQAPPPKIAAPPVKKEPRPRSGYVDAYGQIICNP